MKDLVKLREKYERDLLRKANVVGVGIGYKTVKGKKTDELSLVVLVQKKVPLNELKEKDIIQKELDGVLTDVLETGAFQALQVKRTEKWRPAPGGVSIGHYKVTAGTFGVAVTDRKTGEDLILSNNHVLANSNEGAIGDPILQPGSYDGGTEEDTIAQLHRFVPITYLLDFPTCPIAKGTANAINFIYRLAGSHHRLLPVRTGEEENTVDAAVALPVEKNLIRDGILDIGRIEGIQRPELGISVGKSGRTTEYTEGTVDVIDTTANVLYGEFRIATFSHQIVTSMVSKGGDSGSLAVSGRKAVGLLFAGSETTSIVNPITSVCDALDIEI